MNLTQLQQWQQAVREARSRLSFVMVPADVVLSVMERLDYLEHATDAGLQSDNERLQRELDEARERVLCLSLRLEAEA